MHDPLKLAATQEIVGQHLNMIGNHFKPDAKITLLVRSPDFPERDFILSSDNPAEVRAAIDRRMVSAGKSIETAPVSAGWFPTYRHRKGGLYRVIGRGMIEADKTPAVIYEAEDGTLWVRPAAEFDDGRFTQITQAEANPPPRGDWFWLDGDGETGERTAETAVRNYFDLGGYDGPCTIKVDRAVELPCIFAAVRREEGSKDLTITLHNTEAEAEAAIGGGHGL